MLRCSTITELPALLRFRVLPGSKIHLARYQKQFGEAP